MTNEGGGGSDGTLRPAGLAFSGACCPDSPAHQLGAQHHVPRAAFHRPTSVGELQELVAGADRVRAVGTGHSFNRIADTDGDLVSVADLPHQLSIDPERSTVTVSAGMRYGELAGHLERQGFALPNLGSLPHISIAGACATGTHGSCNANGILATSASALEMVAADGALVTRSRVADGEDFCGSVVALGALGIVTSLTLDTVPTYSLRQYVYEDLPRRQLEDNLPLIFASGYSVSVVVDWRETRLSQVWLKRRVDEDDPWTAEPQWLEARLADSARNMVPGMPPANSTEQLGSRLVEHPAAAFPSGVHPEQGEELQSEYLLPAASAAAALDALDPIADRIASLAQVCELRTVAGDDLWLSPCYGRDTIGFHFTWAPAAAAVEALLPEIEERLADFSPRPHWGKVFCTPPEVVRRAYERFGDFERLAHGSDPASKFRNDFLDRYLHMG